MRKKNATNISVVKYKNRPTKSRLPDTVSVGDKTYTNQEITTLMFRARHEPYNEELLTLLAQIEEVIQSEKLIVPSTDVRPDRAKTKIGRPNLRQEIKAHGR
jgi:hypothetical protein